ncbi:SIMPL domain-containing protein [Paenibacillus flagellatus]|uniref:SIMPL domain-containing protein n=1 Tax=Paenibacillus flagellatus TaxID=2211139 RepID=A0A2V5K911_9BACL|nr:SIMPL domain-containing protein [Paenibacillus flagellatus]PYI54554.1 SIMPL domain-containing protein [Paenibacillus flagellatus]
MVNAKKKWLVAGVAALALTTALYARSMPSLGPTSVYAAEQTAAAKVITVNGTGEMTISPDVAYISLGIRTEAETAKDAQAANAEAYTKLRAVLFDTYKLAEKDVQTSGFRVQPEYTYTDRDPKIKGYSATQMLQVTYRDLDKLGTFLDAASAAGANQIEGVRFSTEKGQEYELQVIQKAMDNAKAKAEAIAKYAGKELKGIVAVNQGGGVAIPSQYSNIAFEAKSAAMDAAGAPTSISTGELKVTTNVTVQYEF